MKKLLYIAVAAATMGLAGACANLDLNPPSQASSETWFSDAGSIATSLNDMYRTAFYDIEDEWWTDRRTDDWAQRVQVYDFCNGSISTNSSIYNNLWTNSYKPIIRAIRVIESIEKLGDPADLQAYKAEALMFRAFMYARLLTCFGYDGTPYDDPNCKHGIPFYTTSITMEEAFALDRTDPAIVAKQIYEDYDAAIEGLPYNNVQDGVWRVNKNAARALAARFALYRGDYEKCAAYCDEVIQSGRNSLYYSTENPADSYGEYFRDKTMNCETLFAIFRSIALKPDNCPAVKNFIARTAGGNAVAQPSWDLLAAYECTDGKLITESPLFDCKDPYKNRDPRCCMTFVEPGTIVYGVEYDPHPARAEVYDQKQDKMVKNKDNKTQDTNCAHNACCLRKGAQMEWRDLQKNENPILIIRYADVLLMYAEAKIESNQIDGSVLNAINDVRARAYGVKRSESGSYPMITTTDRNELRKIVRRERRVEMAWEGRRFFDLRRWGLLEKCYSHDYYGLLPDNELKTAEVQARWFWPAVPEIDEDGFANFEPWLENGWVTLKGKHVYDRRVEWFPIPQDELNVMPHLGQNPYYDNTVEE